ncbi:hypothetical protein [Mycobacterium asiaticum]|uniref:hypothetical protein n=1 Tax=Mycobacterium asiaticum TaxID=1790 RepID=UPI0012DB16EB|nr:hypothetical protein [Mycobacterium asiaticum]
MEQQVVQLLCAQPGGVSADLVQWVVTGCWPAQGDQLRWDVAHAPAQGWRI